MRATSFDTENFVDRSYMMRPMAYMPPGGFFGGVS